MEPNSGQSQWRSPSPLTFHQGIKLCSIYRRVSWELRYLLWLGFEQGTNYLVFIFGQDIKKKLKIDGWNNIRVGNNWMDRVISTPVIPLKVGMIGLQITNWELTIRELAIRELTEQEFNQWELTYNLSATYTATCTWTYEGLMLYQ